MNVICEVGDFDCGAEGSSVLGLYAVCTGKLYRRFVGTTILLILSLSKWRYLNLDFCVYELLHRIMLYPQTMGVESSQRKRTRAKLLHVAVFSRHGGKCLARKLSTRVPSQIAPAVV